MRRAWLLLPVAILLSGCGPKLIQAGGKFQPTPKSIISLSPSTTEVLEQTLTDPSILIGRSSACNYPGVVVHIPVFGGVKPDYEKIKLAKPDLVIFEASLYSPADVEKLKAAAGEGHYFAFHAKDLDDYETSLRQVAMNTNSALRMSEYIDKIDAERNAGKSATSATRPKVVAVSGTLIGGTKGFLADVIQSAGGQPTGPDADRFVEMNPETLVQENPDIILLAVDTSQFGQDKQQKLAEMEKKKAEFLADPRFKGIKAVISKNVNPVDADVLLRDGFRVDQLIHGITDAVGVWAANK